MIWLSTSKKIKTLSSKNIKGNEQRQKIIKNFMLSKYRYNIIPLIYFFQIFLIINQIQLNISLY